MRPSITYIAVSLLTFTVSVIVYFQQAWLGMTGVVMLYLLVVLVGAYYLRAVLAFALAMLAALLINFLVVEPRYTFRIASVESWVALAGFLMVSLVVTSLVRRLQARTHEAESARRQSEFARQMAERLAEEPEPTAVLSTAADLLKCYLAAPVYICRETSDGIHQLPPDADEKPELAAVNWAMQNGKMLGAGTENWPELTYLVVPFSRLPGHAPVLVCALPSETAGQRQAELRSLCDQVALAYERAHHAQRALQAELNARAEAMQNALLASLSHDMRTPLTAILGAISTLDNQDQRLDALSRTQLLHAIRGEAEHLSRSVENVLSLAKLDALGREGLSLDWQSPEEIIGSTLMRYQARSLSCRLEASITSQALIRADAILLSQALANLLDNALTFHQGPEPILISARQTGACLVIAVADRGPGLPAGFSADRLQKYRSATGPGFGLGLVIVSTIAKLHDAALVFEQRMSGGTEVQLRFPLLQPAHHD